MQNKKVVGFNVDLDEDRDILNQLDHIKKTYGDKGVYIKNLIRNDMSGENKDLEKRMFEILDKYFRGKTNIIKEEPIPKVKANDEMGIMNILNQTK